MNPGRWRWIYFPSLRYNFSTMPSQERKGRSHLWDLSPGEAIDLQKELRTRIDLSEDPSEIRTVAGVDLAFDGITRRLIAGIVVFDLRDLTPIETAIAIERESFPYIPGLLSFREIPPILSAWSKLSFKPDCLICDGQGIAHPRRFGIACHLGLLLDLPAIGCAKSRLIGEYEEPPPARGSFSHLYDKGEVIGAVVRTQDGVKPVFVSPGHRITLKRAIEIVLLTSTRYRIPEPTRQADHLVKKMKRKMGAEKIEKDHPAEGAEPPHL